jgi:hypothetical protein
MLRDYILYGVLLLLVAAFLWARRVAARKLRRIRLERMRSTPALNTLMSTIMRSTRPDGLARKAMRSDPAHGSGTVGDTSEILRDDWVRAPNSITGVRRDSD